MIFRIINYNHLWNVQNAFIDNYAFYRLAVNKGGWYKENDLSITMNSKFCFNWFFLLLLLTVTGCLPENSDYKSLQAASCKACDLIVDTNSKYEATEIKLQGDGIVEITAFEPGGNSISRINLFLRSPLVNGLRKSDFYIADINLLTLIRKDNLFLSILRI